MQEHFESAFQSLMYWEGGGQYHIVKGDRGLATKYGISLRFLKGLPLEAADIDRNGHVTKEDIEALTKDNARSFYARYFWYHYGIDRIESAGVSSKLLNIFVNMRGRVAGRVAQRALGSVGVKGIVEDGIVGPITRNYINEITARHSGGKNYLTALRSHQEGVYRLIAAHDKTQIKFLPGWVRRARDQK